MKPRDWIRQRYRQTLSADKGWTDGNRALIDAVIDYIEMADEAGRCGEPLPPPAPAEGYAPFGPTGAEPALSVAAGANGPSDPRGAEYTIAGLLMQARAIWGPEQLSVTDVVVRLGVDFGKLARLARGATKDITTVAEHRAELEACFGNIIFSMLRWADSVGLDVRRSIARAIDAQRAFAEKNPQR